jgi:hypothetical protein
MAAQYDGRRRLRKHHDATATTYTLTAGDYGYFIRLSARHRGVYRHRL